jgi:sugar phosphate isomerase/epimerase
MTRLRLGYGTNGLTDHRLDDALAWLAELGYDGVALTLDHHHLDPFAADLAARVRALSRRLTELGLAVVVETGARFLLDARRKHAPTLLDDDRARRVDLLERAVRIAGELGAEAVSFWSGTKPPRLDDDLAWGRLVEGCSRILDVAERHDVMVGFEPEPGMLVDTLASYEGLVAALDGDARLGLTLDVGHCRCLEPEPIADCVRQSGSRLVNVQIEDMCRGVHEHLDFGLGEIDFPPVLAALYEVGYRGLVSVELPRHSHTAHTVVPRALSFLRGAERQAAVA